LVAAAMLLLIIVRTTGDPYLMLETIEVFKRMPASNQVAAKVPSDSEKQTANVFVLKRLDVSIVTMRSAGAAKFWLMMPLLV
jgi:hypothetical protein